MADSVTSCMDQFYLSLTEITERVALLFACTIGLQSALPYHMAIKILLRIVKS